ALADAEEAIEATTRCLATERIVEKDNKVWLDVKAIPEEYVRRLVLTCLRRIAPEAAPRGEQLTALVDQLRQGKRATMSGVKCSGNTRFLFEREAPRRVRNGI